MAEQQLIEYIKKAREAGQTDDQTRSLLYKNGWTEGEVNDAVASIEKPQPQPQPAAQPQPVAQPRVAEQPQPAVAQPQPQPVVEQPRVQVAAQPQPQTASQQGPQYRPSGAVQTQQRRGGHMFLKLIVVLIILVVLGGAGYFVAGQYINLPGIPWNIFFSGPTPETAINNMMANMKNVKASHSTMQIQVDAASIDTKVSQGKIILNSNSEIDSTDANNPKADGNFTISFTLPGNASPISATVSIAAVDKALYLKINEITVPASLAVPAEISSLKGKWFKIDQNSISALSKLSDAQIELAGASQFVTPDISQKIQGLLSAENLLSVTKQLSDETVSGQSTYHYLVAVNKDGLKDLITEIIMLQMQQETAPAQATGAANPNAVPQNVAQGFANAFVDSLGDINMEMWIGKTDYMLYQVKLDKTINASKLFTPYIGLPATAAINNAQIEIKFTLTNSNFNKPITVQAPAESQKIEDVVLPLIKVMAVTSDMSQIALTAQTFYSASKSYATLCSNGLLNGYLATYGTNLIRLHKDIVSQGATKPSCFANAQDFCISTQLADGSYLCIGKDGKTGTIKCVNAQTACK